MTMTREEAIEIIQELWRYKETDKYTEMEIRQALDIAIKALEQEPCEDCIIRKSLLDTSICEGISCNECSFNTCEDGQSGCLLGERISKLPPVQPEPKIGHWITQWNVAHQKEYYYCSECREEFSYDGETGIKMNDYNLCPKCGAKMEVKE